jgi:ribosomal protein S18 acetylase RimI-like enzyme
MGYLKIKNAEKTDARALAQIADMAGHGLMQLLYEGLLPGKSLIDTIIERRIFAPRSFSALARWRIATDGSGNILGGLNSFSHDVMMTAPPDPLLDESRLSPIAALSEMEATAVDSYYINIIAVFPEYRGSGAGFALMQEAERLARKENLRRLTLSAFENDPSLLRFYRRQGFEVHASCPIGQHSAFQTDGNFVLMMRELDA